MGSLGGAAILSRDSLYMDRQGESCFARSEKNTHAAVLDRYRLNIAKSQGILAMRSRRPLSVPLPTRSLDSPSSTSSSAR